MHAPSLFSSVRDSEPSVSSLVLLSKNNSDSLHLNLQQVVVLDFVKNHLFEHLKGKDPPQCLMIVHGEEGTGKSTVVHAITKLFEDNNVGNLLAKTTMSGVASCIIGGQTLHSWAALPVITLHSDKWLTHPSKEVNECRKSNIARTLWLIIHEMSMLTTPSLQLLS